MARLVKRFRSKPYLVTIGGETQYICGCGLSSTLPFCNGNHKLVQSESSNALYWYDEDGNRHEVADAFDEICSDELTKDA